MFFILESKTTYNTELKQDSARPFFFFKHQRVAHMLRNCFIVFFSLVYVISLSLEREGCNIFAAENPKITEALGGTVQRYYRSFHRCLPSDMTNIEPELINPSGPRLTHAVLPGCCSSHSGFHGNATAWTSHRSWAGFVRSCCVVLGSVRTFRSWGVEKDNAETPGGSSWASKARAICSLSYFIPFTAR